MQYLLKICPFLFILNIKTKKYAYKKTMAPVQNFSIPGAVAVIGYNFLKVPANPSG